MNASILGQIIVWIIVVPMAALVVVEVIAAIMDAIEERNGFMLAFYVWIVVLLVLGGVYGLLNS